MSIRSQRHLHPPLHPSSFIAGTEINLLHPAPRANQATKSLTRGVICRWKRNNYDVLCTFRNFFKENNELNLAIQKNKPPLVEIGRKFLPMLTIQRVESFCIVIWDEEKYLK